MKKFEGPTMPSEEHEVPERFTLEYKGDTLEFAIARADYEKFKEIARSRKVRESDLLRAAIDRYGMEENVIKKIIEEGA